MVLVAGVCWACAWSTQAAAAAKTRTATGELTTNSQGEWSLRMPGKGQALQFRVNDETKIWKESELAAGELAAGMLVRMNGRGQNDVFTATRIQCLAPEESRWQEAKKQRTGAAYPDRARTTSLTARIQKPEPLTVCNRFGQVIRVERTPRTLVLRRSRETLAGLAAGTKAQVTYSGQGNAAQAVEIVLKQPGEGS